MTGPAGRDHPLDGLLTLMWHYVREPDESPPVGAGWVEPDAFDAQLDAIGASRTVVTWRDVAAALEGGRPLPRRAALLTFDDGLVDHHRTVLPRLVGRGWSGIFFVTARRPAERLSVGHKLHVLLAQASPAELRDAVVAALEPADLERFEAAERQARVGGADGIDVLKLPLQRDLAEAAAPILSAMIEARGPEGAIADALHLSPAQVADLRDAGMTIGGHGRRHLWMDFEPGDVVRDEVAESAAFAAANDGSAPFAYPYGAAGPTAVAALREAGFAAAFHASPRRATGRFDLGRVDAETGDLAAALAGSAGR